MTTRKKIQTAICTKLKDLDGISYVSNVYGNSFPVLKFWDQVQNFPCIYSSIGPETREYLPGGFKWGFIGIPLKVYCKGDTAQDQLEQILADIEKVLDSTKGVLVYDIANNLATTEFTIISITTDEGLLAPYAVGEINLQVRYQVP